MKNFLYLIEFFFVYIFFRLLSFFPLSFSRKVSSHMFKFIGKLTYADKTAIQNCETVFPKFNKNKIRNIVDKSWINLGETICELSCLKKVINNNNIVKIKGLENIRDILKNNKQAIFISIHQSNWEVLVPTLDKMGINIGAIYRHINNFFVDKLILNIRNKSLLSNKSFYTPKGKKSAKDLLEAINKKFSIVLLIDQKDTAGENVLFFNKQVKTQTGFLKISRKFNLPIIPIKNTRFKNGQIELNFQKPIYNTDDQVDDSKMMDNIHKIVENWIISNPEQWFWQHKRFN